MFQDFSGEENVLESLKTIDRFHPAQLNMVLLCSPALRQFISQKMARDFSLKDNEKSVTRFLVEKRLRKAAKGKSQVVHNIPFFPYFIDAATISSDKKESNFHFVQTSQNDLKT